jgi:hypothetical protein
MILAARILLGWIKPEDLIAPQEDDEAAVGEVEEGAENDGGDGLTPLPEPGTGA